MLNRLIYFQTHSAEKGALYYVPGSIHMGHLTQFVGDHHDPLPGEVKILPTAVRCLIPVCPSDRLRTIVLSRSSLMQGTVIFLHRAA